MSFCSLGTLLVFAACFTLFVIPSDYDENLAPEEADGGPRLGMLDALKVPFIALAAYSILSASCSTGFLLTLLEPPMRQFNLTPLAMGKDKSEDRCDLISNGECLREDAAKAEKLSYYIRTPVL